MDTVDIVARFIDEASAGIERLAANTASAFTGATRGVSSFGTSTTGVLAGFGNAATKAFSGVKNWLTNLTEHLRWASVFVSAAVMGIGSSMLSMAGSLEQTHTGFDILLKDEKKTAEAMEFIEKWALETPFSVNEATDSFKRFLAVTGNLKTTEQFMTALGDATVATGGNINEFNFAARGLTQIMAMSKVRAQEMYQLVNANIPAFDILAKAVQNGELKVEGITTAINKNIGPTRAMIAANQKATEQFDIYVTKSEGAEKKVQELKDANKQGTAAFKNAEAAVMSAHLTLDKAQVSIKNYNTAAGQTAKVGNAQAMSLTQIKGLLQDVGTLNISGAEASKIFLKYFQEAYGGAAAKQVDTLIGKQGQLTDLLYFTSAVLLGYNKKTGETYGIYKKIKDALEILNNYLEKNRDQFVKIGEMLGKQEVVWALVGMAIGMVYGALTGIIGPIIAVMGVFGGLGIVVGALASQWGRVATFLQNFKRGFEELPYAIRLVVTALAYFWASFAGGVITIIGTMYVVGTLVSAFTGLIGVLATVKNAITLLWAVMWLNPFTAAVAGVFLLAGGLAFLMTQTNLLNTYEQNQKILEDNLKTTRDALTRATIARKDAEMMLKNSVLDSEGAGLALERAEQNLLTIEQSYGPGTLEYREALFQVKTAKERVRDANQQVIKAQDDLMTKQEEEAVNSIKYNDSLDKTTEHLKAQKTTFENLSEAIRQSIDNWKMLLGLGGKNVIPGSENGIFNPLKRQHGGFVPGPIGAPVPILAHGGERVVSATGVDGGGASSGVSVNFYGAMTLDSESRIDELVNRITRILGRQNEMARYGVGY